MVTSLGKDQTGISYRTGTPTPRIKLQKIRVQVPRSRHVFVFCQTCQHLTSTDLQITLSDLVPVRYVFARNARRCENLRLEATRLCVLFRLKPTRPRG
jgi:hypothetical protein